MCRRRLRGCGSSLRSPTRRLLATIDEFEIGLGSTLFLCSTADFSVLDPFCMMHTGCPTKNATRGVVGPLERAGSSGKGDPAHPRGEPAAPHRLRRPAEREHRL